jgi:hypothetical protein
MGARPCPPNSPACRRPPPAAFFSFCEGTGCAGWIAVRAPVPKFVVTNSYYICWPRIIWTAPSQAPCRVYCARFSVTARKIKRFSRANIPKVLAQGPRTLEIEKYGPLNHARLSIGAPTAGGRLAATRHVARVNQQSPKRITSAFRWFRQGRLRTVPDDLSGSERALAPGSR